MPSNDLSAAHCGSDATHRTHDDGVGLPTAMPAAKTDRAALAIGDRHGGVDRTIADDLRDALTTDDRQCGVQFAGRGDPRPLLRRGQAELPAPATALPQGKQGDQQAARGHAPDIAVGGKLQPPITAGSVRPDPETLTIAECHQGDADGGMPADEGTQMRFGLLQQLPAVRGGGGQGGGSWSKPIRTAIASLIGPAETGHALERPRAGRWRQCAALGKIAQVHAGRTSPGQGLKQSGEAPQRLIHHSDDRKERLLATPPRRRGRMAGMVTGIIFALLAGCGFACGAALFAAVARRGLPFMAFLGTGAALAVFPTLLLVVDWKALPDASRSGELSGWIVLGALANVTGHHAISRAMQGGNAPVAWAISQAGQAVPFVVAAAYWSDPTHPLAWAGLAAVLGGVVALARGRSASSAVPSTSWPAWAIAALACYGINGSLMAVPSRWPGWSDTAHLRLPLTLGVFAVCGLLATRAWSAALLRRLLPFALPYAAVLTGCFLCLYLALDRLTAAGAAAVAWPVACGSGITLFSLWEGLAMRRPPTRSAVAGIALLIIGIAGLAIRPH